jgi:hypothetical protein
LETEIAIGDDLLKKILLLCFAFMYLLVPFGSAEAPDKTTELFQAQTLENMQAGIYVIPEEVLNAYFAENIASNPKVKDSTINIHKDNKFTLTTTVEKTGTIRLNCTIKQFHFDKDNALLRLHIDKKELIGHSITSWFFNQMSLGFITDLYGNPLKQANIDSKVNGNTIDLNLKPFAASLFTTGIGQAFGDQLVITNVTTDDKAIYLHTNLAISLMK